MAGGGYPAPGRFLSPPPEDPIWTVTQEDIQAAANQSPNSTPGPDGIPFQVWRKLGSLAAECIHNAYLVLATPQGADTMMTEHPEFNASDVVFLPKAVTGTDTQLGEYCTPEDTRPLNIANTDNRLLSNAVRMRLEPILDKLISPMQWGFLPGRSLLSNVVDIDEGMTTAALCQEEGAALLFDFKAAFPSVLHSFLMEVLRHRSSAAVDALPRRSVHQQHLLVGPWRE